MHKLKQLKQIKSPRRATKCVRGRGAVGMKSDVRLGGHVSDEDFLTERGADMILLLVPQVGISEGDVPCDQADSDQTTL